MRRDMTRVAMSRFALCALAIGIAASLQACTTVEGTNAMTDVGTFEREVMTSTLQGVGIVDKEQKEPLASRRAPLVLPKQTQVLPQPEDQSVADAALPKDSDNVQIDTTGLSNEDIARLRRARVVDINSVTGRELTDLEQRQLTARFMQARGAGNGRSIYTPPDEYFTTVNGQEMVCLAANGDLVPLNDKACPPAIRKALGG